MSGAAEAQEREVEMLAEAIAATTWPDLTWQYIVDHSDPERFRKQARAAHAALAPVRATEQQETERKASERAWDEGVQWARDEINEFARFSGKHIADQPRMTNAVIQPHYDALDAVPGGIGHSRYNDHIASVAFMSAVDTITPMLDPPPGYEPDDDPNPYRGGEGREGTDPADGADR